MTEVQILRAELDQLRDTTEKLFILLATSVGEKDAKPLLVSLTANYRAALNAEEPPPNDFNAFAVSLLLNVSSLALKQHPEDPEVQSLYRLLRPGL